MAYGKETKRSMEHNPDNDIDVETKTTSAETEEAIADDVENTISAPKRKRKRKRKRAGGKDDDGDNKNNDKEQEERENKLGSLDYTVYMEGIPFDASEDQVKDFFSTHGISDLLQLRLPKWQDSGRLRGYGHVVFDSKESREKAIRDLDRKYMGKRYVTITAPQKPRHQQDDQGSNGGGKPREQPPGCSRVFVKNLPYGASEEDIHAVFAVCGKILEGGVRIARNYQTRESKGFCYIDFKNPEGALAAVQKASKPFGMVVDGRPCYVDYDEGQMKSSYKTQEGRMWSKEYNKNNKRSRK